MTNIEKYTGNYDPSALYIQYLTDDLFELAPAKAGDVGMDLPVRVDGVKVNPDMVHIVDGEERSIYIYDDHFFIPPTGKAEVPTGLRVKVPDGMWGNLKARSSTGWKKSLEVFEGVIDPGYTGNLFALVFNPTNKPVRINDGDRLAQLILCSGIYPERILTVNKMPKTERGSTGFGSTG